jgi:hypothetical protein
MTKRNASDLNWITVDEASMNAALTKRLAEVRDLAKKHADARAAFELQFVAAVRKAGSLDEGNTLAFGYRFGKLSVAKTEDKPRTPAASAKPMFKF